MQQQRELAVLADANPQARRMGCAYLSDLGWEVEAVGDGSAALAALARRPQLVLVDAALPGMPGASAQAWGGVELCRRVKAEAAATPVLILLGAMARVPEAELALADGVLRKPLSSAGLERWMQSSRQSSTQTSAQASSGPAEAQDPELSPEAMLAAAIAAAARGERE
ncbi:MAG: response regulator transcription factor [Terriglobales bacterium]